MKRIAALLVLASGCAVDIYEGVVVTDAQVFDAQLIYDGSQTTSTISFPAITRANEDMAVAGSVTGFGLTAATYTSSSSTIEIQVTREPGDDQGSLTPLLCVVHEEDLGHATRCGPTSKTASIIVEVQ